MSEEIFKSTFEETSMPLKKKRMAMDRKANEERLKNEQYPIYMKFEGNFNAQEKKYITFKPLANYNNLVFSFKEGEHSHSAFIVHQKCVLRITLKSLFECPVTLKLLVNEKIVAISNKHQKCLYLEDTYPFDVNNQFGFKVQKEVLESKPYELILSIAVLQAS